MSLQRDGAPVGWRIGTFLRMLLKFHFVSLGLKMGQTIWRLDWNLACRPRLSYAHARAELMRLLHATQFLPTRLVPKDSYGMWNFYWGDVCAACHTI